MTKSVAICVPRFGGLIQGKTSDAIDAAKDLLVFDGWHVEKMYIDHESLITRARNTLVHLMLKSRCDRLLFIDGDILFAPTSVLALLQRPEEVVGAAYPRKALNWPAIRAACQRGEEHPQRYAADFVVNVIRPIESGVVTAPVKDGCLLEVEALGTGFMAITRECLLTMCEAYPETAYVDDGRQNHGEAIHALFDTGIVEQRYLSEDYLFCQRWRRIGGQCWLHLGIPLGHIGQHTYAGDLHTVFEPVTS